MMDWFNTGLYRDLGYGMVYGQVLPDYVYSDAAVQSAVLARAQKKANHWLQILNDSVLGANKKFVCGSEITLADYLGVCFLTLGEVAQLKYDAYPNVTRWISTLKSRPTWAKANEGFYQYFVGGYKDRKFLPL
jgi:glutathione S-transferase